VRFSAAAGRLRGLSERRVAAVQRVLRLAAVENLLDGEDLQLLVLCSPTGLSSGAKEAAGKGHSLVGRN